MPTLARVLALVTGLLFLGTVVGEAQQALAKPKEWYVGLGQWVKSTEPQPIPTTVVVIGSEQLKAMLDQDQKFFLVDARNGAEYREGRIPRAVHVYDKEMEGSKARFPQDKITLLVFYCNGYPECPRSLNAAKIALEWGYRNVRLYKDGIPEWMAKGYPVER